MAATTDTNRGDLDSAREVLVSPGRAKPQPTRAQADLMVAAVTWAEQHPPESIEAAATWVTPGGDTGLPLAGGAPPGGGVLHRRVRPRDRSLHRRRTGVVAAAVELKYRLPGCLGPGAVR